MVEVVHVCHKQCTSTFTLSCFSCLRSLRFCPNSSENEEKLKALLPNMEICGAIEFKMDKKSYRMIPLAKSEDYLYSKQSLKRARQVCAYRLYSMGAKKIKQNH